MTPDQAARIRGARAAALARGDHNLVRECDHALGPDGGEQLGAAVPLEQAIPAPLENRRPGRPRKDQVPQ